MAQRDLREMLMMQQMDPYEQGYQEYLSGMNALAQGIPQYAQAQQEEEQKRLELQQKEREKEEKEFQKKFNLYSQIKQLRPEIEDSKIMDIVNMESGPLKQSALSAIKKGDPSWFQSIKRSVGYEKPTRAEEYLGINQPNILEYFMKSPENESSQPQPTEGQQPPQEIAQQMPEKGFTNPLISLLRGAAGVGVRALEGFGGFPLQIAKNIGNLPQASFTDERIAELPVSEEVKEKLRQERDTPRGLLEVAKQATPAKTNLEKMAQEVGESVGLLSSGGVKNLAQGKRLLKAAGLGNLAGWGTKAIGAGPLIQESVKLMTMLGVNSGLVEKGAKAIGNVFNISRRIGKEVDADAKKFWNIARDSYKSASRGGEGTSKQKAIKNAYDAFIKKIIGEPEEAKAIIKELEQSPEATEKLIPNVLKNKEINASTLQDFVTGISDRIEDVGGRKTAAGKALEGLRKKLSNALMNPEITSPKYAKAYKLANQSYRQLKDAQKINNWLTSSLPRNVQNRLSALGILRRIGAATAGRAFKTAVTPVTTLYQMARNPIAKKEYARLMKAAVQKNPNAAVRAAESLLKSLGENKKTK